MLNFPVINKQQQIHIGQTTTLSCPWWNHGCNKSGHYPPLSRKSSSKVNNFLSLFFYIRVCAKSSTNAYHRCLLGCLFLQVAASTFRAQGGQNQTVCSQQTLDPLCPGSQNKNPELPQWGSVSWTYPCSENNISVKLQCLQKEKIIPNSTFR